MRVVFFDKKKETYEAIDNVSHMHLDPYFEAKRKKIYVLYTDKGIKFFPCCEYDFYKVDGI